VRTFLRLAFSNSLHPYPATVSPLSSSDFIVRSSEIRLTSFGFSLRVSACPIALCPGLQCARLHVTSSAAKHDDDGMHRSESSGLVIGTERIRADGTSSGGRGRNCGRSEQRD
jgi:hypothetical protein